MQTTVEKQVREWKKGETLDNLQAGDVARFCDRSSMLDGHFEGLYDGKDGRKHVVYSRTLEPEHSGKLRLKLTGNGFISTGWFLFDGYREAEEVDSIEDPEEQQIVEEALRRKGL